MARRGFAIIFTVLGIAFVVSIAGFALLYVVLGREPAIRGNSVLVLRLAGDLAEVDSGDVVGFLRGGRTPTVRTIVDSLRKAKADPRIRAVLLKPSGFASPYWGKVQEIRDALLEFKKAGSRRTRTGYGGDRDTTRPRPTKCFAAVEHAD
jgi:protease-4